MIEAVATTEELGPTPKRPVKTINWGFTQFEQAESHPWENAFMIGIAALFLLGFGISAFF